MLRISFEVVRSYARTLSAHSAPDDSYQQEQQSCQAYKKMQSLMLPIQNLKRLLHLLANNIQGVEFPYDSLNTSCCRLFQLLNKFLVQEIQLQYPPKEDEGLDDLSNQTLFCVNLVVLILASFQLMPKQHLNKFITLIKLT